METMPCYHSLSHNSLCLLFDFSNTNRTGADVCAYFPVVLRKHTPSLFTPSPMVLLHVSHRYLIVRVHYVMQKCWNANTRPHRRPLSPSITDIRVLNIVFLHLVQTGFDNTCPFIRLFCESSVLIKCLHSV